MSQRVTVWAVVRTDLFLPEDAEHRLTVTEVLPTREAALDEVARLQALQDDRLGEGKVRYMALATRWYPDGRDVEDASP
jgi:hypothetical protein